MFPFTEFYSKNNKRLYVSMYRKTDSKCLDLKACSWFYSLRNFPGIPLAVQFLFILNWRKLGSVPGACLELGSREEDCSCCITGHDYLSREHTKEPCWDRLDRSSSRRLLCLFPKLIWEWDKELTELRKWVLFTHAPWGGVCKYQASDGF